MKESHLRILKGGAASSPDDMVRARFSAVRSKDAVFMAKTEAFGIGLRGINHVKDLGNGGGSSSIRAL